MAGLMNIVAAVLIIVLVSAVTLAQEVPKETDTKALAQGNTLFGLGMYGELASREKGNVFFSPYSISEAMTMTCLGAGGQTRKEMQKVLCVPTKSADDKAVAWSNDDLAAAYKDLHARLSSSDAKFQRQRRQRPLGGRAPSSARPSSRSSTTSSAANSPRWTFPSPTRRPKRSTTGSPSRPTTASRTSCPSPP